MTKIKNAQTYGWLVCSLAAVFYCYEFLLRIEPTIMVNELMQAFNVNATELGTFSACFYFIYAPLQIVVGLLLDTYGARRILTLAVVACALGSYIFGSSTTLYIASIGRFLIGFGSAFAFVASLKLAASWLPARFFALFVGLTTALGMLGAIFGVIIMNVLVTSIGWKETINIGTIVGLILIPITWIIVRDKPKINISSVTLKKSKADYKNTILGFVQILKNPLMWINGSIACCMYLALSLFAELWGIPFLKSAYPNENSANLCSMVFLGWLIGGPLAGYTSDVFRDKKRLISLGCLLSSVFVSIVIYIPNMPTTMLYISLFAFGIFSSFEILCFAISGEHSPKELIASASAFTNFLTMIGGIIVQPLIGKILDLTWSQTTLNNARIYSTTSYKIALSILPVAFFIGFILSFWLPKNSQTK